MNDADASEKDRLKFGWRYEGLDVPLWALHWAAIELRMKGESNAAINEEIIMERHYALNWLIRYMNQGWDAITPGA
ncbi:conserved hypothetical protein [Hahella chejuensis KCTC 2396]|uniref:DUF4272 domain-containing protein n=1 Tax=Hahella chejuensis (strain KCTC 2396) TaxID=349521 RepID=Q2SG29_HAHCH|nr:DUF4272 domain-containing protein [Hahella chejuensis]ABC30395.1 conserved hypothetical protein [Hahella chejuensis KCTC 2396]